MHMGGDKMHLLVHIRVQSHNKSKYEQRLRGLRSGL
jgi:hypothetical protein